MYLSIHGYNTADGIAWRMASVRPARTARDLGLYVWERTGFVHLETPPVTSRAMIQAILDELQRTLGERQDLDVSRG